MRFRKDSINFYEGQILYVIMAILSIFVMPRLGFVFSFIPLFIFSVLALTNSLLYNEFITINELGIQCHKKDVLLWSYEWSSIAELKRGSRYLLPSIEVITFNTQGKAEQFAVSNQYFQLGKVAKKAVKKYWGTQGRF